MPQYCVISPCRNEAPYLWRTIESVAGQTRPPALWVIVDDGSTDQTPQLLEKASRMYPFIRVVRREDRGRRSVGPGVIEAFYAGLDQIDLRNFDYLCKLDLDLVMPSQYFETLLQRMELNPRLGTVSGKAFYIEKSTGRHVLEHIGDDVSIGAAKLYRTDCFKQIGGFERAVMWDGIDCHRCRMLGWIALSWDEPALRFEHLRPMGTSDKGIWHGRMRHGRGQWFMGTSFAYITASALFRVARPPAVIGSLAIWLGYVTSMLRREPRYGELEFRLFLRRYQRLCLVFGKAKAMKILDRERALRWAGRSVATSA